MIKFFVLLSPLQMGLTNSRLDLGQFLQPLTFLKLLPLSDIPPFSQTYFDWLPYLLCSFNTNTFWVAFFFSMDPHKANLQLRFPLFNSRLRFNSTLIFLMVTVDRTLSSSKHVSSMKAKFFSHLKALLCICAFSWGLSKESLSLLYKAFFGPFSLMLHPDSFLF